MTVADLARSADKPVTHIQEAMLYVKNVEEMEPHSQLHDLKIIKDIMAKCGMKMKIVAAPTTTVEETKDKDIFPRPPASQDQLKPRPPVVTVMGHVDHGKTTLLDTLRGASVAAGEAGGITQHIGAFTVELTNDEAVTFLDTPGHAAFSAMRARGAHCTDIIVLVVAADDGVMAQTKEVVQLAQDAKVPLIVVINKIDKPEADLERTKRSLLQAGVALEGHGGDVQYVGISALKGLNLDELTETISAQATLMDVRADPTGLVEGVVVESRTDSHRGRLSTSIITRGTLRRGSILVSGTSWAKVRGLFDHAGQPMNEASPGQPVEIIGWRDLPLSGEQILEVESEKKAHSVVRYRDAQAKLEKAEMDREAIQKKEQEHLEQYRAARDARRRAGYFRSRQVGPRQKESAPDDGIPRVNVIVKADVHGSVEAILDVLETYDDMDQCKLDVIHYGVGDISEGDLELAKTFNAIIYAFSVKSPPPKSCSGVTIKDFDVIYHMVDDLKAEISKKLPMTEEENVQGKANILQIFEVTEGKKKSKVLGSRCTDGVLKKSAKVKLIRNNDVIYVGEWVRRVMNGIGLGHGQMIDNLSSLFQVHCLRCGT